MDVHSTPIPGLLLLEPRIFSDERGFFMESYNKREFSKLSGLDVEFVQDNHSRSTKNVLRGLHYQIQQSQGKLVRVTKGSVFDVVVDIRKSSPTFGQWYGIELTENNHLQLWIPPTLAHGYLVLSDQAEFLYKTTDYYSPKNERCIIWDDPDIAIEWPTRDKPLVSEKDSMGNLFQQADLFA